MSQIFISYAREDQAKAQIVVQRLEREGWDVWWDQELIPGEIWDDHIQKAVEEALCVIVLWSKESVKSEWVRAEAREGRRHKKLIPILLDQVKLPMPFSLIQSGKLMGWEGNPADSRLDPLMAAVRHVVEKKPGVPRVGASGLKKMPGQWKTKASTLAMLLLPMLITGVCLWVAMSWHRPTKVDISLWTSRLDFTLRNTEGKRGLLKPIPFKIIQIEHFSEIKIVPDSIERFDQAQALEPTVATGEQGWIPLMTTPGPISFLKPNRQAVPVLQMEFFQDASPGVLSKGKLELLETKGIAELSLVLSGRKADQLTVDVWAEQTTGRVLIPPAVLIELRETALLGAHGSGERRLEDGLYRIRVQPENGSLNLVGRPQERKVQGSVVVGERLLMVVELDSQKELSIFEKGLLPVQSVRFVEGQDKYDKVQPPEVFGGEIHFPQAKDKKGVKIPENYFLVLEGLHEGFHIKSLTRNLEKKALKVQMSGTVGEIRVGGKVGNTTVVQDLRLTVFERLLGDQMLAMLGSMMVVVLTTTLGARRLWKELST